MEFLSNLVPGSLGVLDIVSKLKFKYYLVWVVALQQGVSVQTEFQIF